MASRSWSSLDWGLRCHHYSFAVASSQQQRPVPEVGSHTQLEVVVVAAVRSPLPLERLADPLKPLFVS